MPSSQSLHTAMNSSKALVERELDQAEWKIVLPSGIEVKVSNSASKDGSEDDGESEEEEATEFQFIIT